MWYQTSIAFRNLAGGLVKALVYFLKVVLISMGSWGRGGFGIVWDGWIIRVRCGCIGGLCLWVP